jgi:hypothetical protein
MPTKPEWPVKWALPRYRFIESDATDQRLALLLTETEPASLWLSTRGFVMVGAVALVTLYNVLFERQHVRDGIPSIG